MSPAIFSMESISTVAYRVSCPKAAGNCTRDGPSALAPVFNSQIWQPLKVADVQSGQYHWPRAVVASHFYFVWVSLWQREARSVKPIRHFNGFAEQLHDTFNASS